MGNMNSLVHTKWNCKYHIVFAPKYMRKTVAFDFTNSRTRMLTRKERRMVEFVTKVWENNKSK